jgi:hypothetical protein
MGSLLRHLDDPSKFTRDNYPDSEHDTRLEANTFKDGLEHAILPH